MKQRGVNYPVAVILSVATIAILAGFFHLTQATLGVGLITFACYLGIVARIAQVESQKHGKPQQ